MADATALRLAQYNPVDDEDKTRAVLTSLLEHAPSERGRQTLRTEIASCQNDAQLYLLSQRYIEGLLKPIKALGGRTPAISDHPSRASSVRNVQEIAVLLETAKRDQRALKEVMLRRDGYKCVVSGFYDLPSSALGLVQLPNEADEGFTNAAHIIPFSFVPKNESSANVKRSANIFDVLSRYSGYNFLAELNGTDINRPANVLTLREDIHTSFGALLVWFEEVADAPNTYRFRKRTDRKILREIHDGTQVIFTSTDPEIELPNPAILRLHAACAKVLWASGMAKCIDHWIRDYEEVKVLAEDGSAESFRLLESALLVMVSS